MSPGKFMKFAKENFQNGISGEFSRDTIRHPLLVTTPQTEKETMIKLWKVLLRYMGDVTDYRFNLERPSHQPNLGSVMSRLVKELGIQSEDMKLSPSYKQREPPLTKLPNKPVSATLRQLHITLTQRLVKKERPTVFSILPLEESLMTNVDQVHFIIGYCILKPQLRDEIYCALCKQLTKNPFKESIRKGWGLMTLLASVFLPTSENITNVLEDFIDNGPPVHSRKIKQLMDKVRENGTRFQPPTSMEIKAVETQTLIQIEVTLMDGSTLNITSEGASLSRDICRKIGGALGIVLTEGFSLYIAMYGKVASLGNGNDYVMDAISQCEQIHRDNDTETSVAPWTLYYRKETFIPWVDVTKDDVAMDLVIAQIMRGVVVEEYVLSSDNELAWLASCFYIIDKGHQITAEDIKSNLSSYIPKSCIENDLNISKWTAKIYNKLKELNVSSEKSTVRMLKENVINYATSHLTIHFCRLYDVINMTSCDWSDDVIRLAVGGSGISLVYGNIEDYKWIPYTDIGSVDASVEILSIVFMDGSSLKMLSRSPQEVKEHISYFMNELLQHSRYAVTLQSYNAIDSMALSYTAGALLVLDKPSGQGAFKDHTFYATNDETGGHGYVVSDNVHVLPVTTKPDTSILERYREPLSKKHITKEFTSE